MIKVIRGLTFCREYENGERTCCSFQLPTKLDFFISKDQKFTMNFYAKEIKLEIGDIIYSYYGVPYRVIGGNITELMVEEVKKNE